MPIDWGSLRRLDPFSRTFGLDRGLPLDRYYIERFLETHAADIHGRTLEVGDASYTHRFGSSRVTRADILHTPPGGRSATLVGDLSTGQGIPVNAFDAMILTQVLPFIFDLHGTLRTIHRCLRPGGVALITVAGISQISRYDMDRWGDYWRFTNLSCQRLFEPVFGAPHVQVNAYGNVLAATAFLQGLPSQMLTPEELDYLDPDYQLLLTIRAVKGTTP